MVDIIHVVVVVVAFVVAAATGGGGGDGVGVGVGGGSGGHEDDEVVVWVKKFHLQSTCKTESGGTYKTSPPNLRVLPRGMIHIARMTVHERQQEAL